MENLFLIIIFLILSLLVFGFVFKDQNANQFKFRTILYSLIYSVLIGIGGIFDNKGLIAISSTTLYYMLIGWMLVLGLLHVIFRTKILPWTIKNKFWTELALTLGIGFLGSALILVIFHFSGSSTFVKIYLTSILIFLVPFLFYSTYLLYLNIPVKILRKWQYPVDKHIDDPSDREMESPLVVGFEFKKKPDDENMTTFRAKAPKEMTFGKLFYYFINDYNNRNPDEKIEYLDDKNKPVSWIFYIKPTWFSGIRYIDPQETNSFNFIKENSVIVCKRVTEK
jgi:hypothetical protein